MENIDKSMTENAATDITNAANLDALTAPEGGYDADITGTVTGASEDALLDSTHDTNGLPNLDPPVDNTEDMTATMPIEGEVAQETHTNDYWQKPFDKLKEEVDGFELPEDLSEENYLDYLKEYWSQDAPQPDVHPDLMKIQNALNEGAEITEILKDITTDFDVMKLSDKDLLRLDISKTNDNWDDDKVSDVINRLDNAGMLELEAERVRNRVRNFHEDRMNNLESEAKSAKLQQREKNSTERNEQIDQALKTFNEMDEVYGLPISKAEKAEFSDYFKTLVTPDDSGVAPMFQMLQSNENLVKLAAMMWKGDDKVRSAITDAKESGKNAIKSKLPGNPKTFGNNGPMDPNKIDLDALSAPERLVI